MKPFEIKFKHISEIRHGSPYNLVELTHTACRNINIKAHNDWQDKQSWSSNGNYVALVKWDFVNEDPGFIVILLETNSGKMTQSSRIKGCCEKITISNDLFINYQTFTLISDNKERKEYGLKEGIIKIE
jgi:hypothetical protein